MPALTPKKKLPVAKRPHRTITKSLAHRLPPLRSAGSSRGAILSETDNRPIVFESALERGFATLMLARPDVAEVIDQQAAYYLVNGKEKKHVFDFVVVMTSGEKIAVAVKPWLKAEKYGLHKEMKRIAQHLDPSFADRIVVATDRDIDRVQVHDAELVLFFNREEDDEADKAIEALIAELHGAVKIAHLVERTGLGSRAFRAIVRAFGAGRLVKVTHKPIGLDTLVRVRDDAQ